jgi:hypothetical protein
MQSICALVQEGDETSFQAQQDRVGVLIASVDRQFSVRAHRQSSPSHWARLAPDAHSNRWNISGARAHSASRQGMLGGVAGNVEHLGVLLDTRQMGVFVTEKKEQRIRNMVQEILFCVGSASASWFHWEKLVTAAEWQCHLTLALLMNRLYTRSLSFDMSLAGFREEERGPSQREVRSKGRAERGPRGGPSVTRSNGGTRNPGTR